MLLELQCTWVKVADLWVNRALQAKALELERQQVTDSLKKGLEHRSERDELIGRKLTPTILPARLYDMSTYMPWEHSTGRPQEQRLTIMYHRQHSSHLDRRTSPSSPPART